MKRLGLWAFGLGWGLIGCGGRTIESSGGGGGSAVSDPPPKETASGQAGKSGSNGSSLDLPMTTLGACKPGFDRLEHPELLCHWLTETGMCFDDTQSACNCICPVDRDSVCVHGFDNGPGSASRIVCD